MKHTLLTLALFVSPAMPAAESVVVVNSASNITVGGVSFGKPADAIANNKTLAPAIQRALEAWEAQRDAAHAKALAELRAAKAALEAENTRLLAAIDAAKAKATTAPGRALMDGLVTEARKTEKARKRAAIEAEIVAKQAELSKLGN